MTCKVEINQKALDFFLKMHQFTPDEYRERFEGIDTPTRINKIIEEIEFIKRVDKGIKNNSIEISDYDIKVANKIVSRYYVETRTYRESRGNKID